MDEQDNERERKRRIASEEEEEEEAWHADEEYRQQKADEEEAANRQSAIDDMVVWFHEQFEDPQDETPYDSEDGEYVYVFGGPFNAMEVLSEQFGSEYRQDWVESAVEQVQATGTFEWAPSAQGDYYEHPESEISEDAVGNAIPRELTRNILQRLDDLEKQLAVLSSAPPSIGHNQAPGNIGLPPYNDDGRRELEDAITATRQELSETRPHQARLEQAENTFRRVSSAILKWIGTKLDLAVDESIKVGVKATGWGTAAYLALGLADELRTLIGYLI